MNLLKTIRSSPIIKKLLRRIFLVEIISLGVICIICYFVLWPRLMEDSVEKALNRQNEASALIEDFVANLDNAAMFVATSTDLKSALDQYYANPNASTYESVNLRLHYLCSNTANLRSVILCSEDGLFFNSIVNIKKADWDFFETHSTSASQSYSGLYPLGTSPETYGLCHTQDFYIGNQKYTFFFFYKVSSIVNIYDSLCVDTFDNYSFLSVDYSPIYTAKENHDFLNVALDFSDSYQHIGQGYYFKCLIPRLNWYAISYSSNATFHQEIFDTFLLVILLGIIFFLLVLFFLSPVVAHQLSPITKLNRVMQKVTTDNIDVRSDIQTKDEIGELSKVFNMMLDVIHEHIRIKLENERNLYRVQYNLLIAQIDSHFICNTMSIINSLARKGKNSEIIEINTALVQILQNCLRVKTWKITDTIAQELNILNQYFVIEKKRYDNEAELHIRVPEDLMNFEIPKNIIQPIVENSFRHGLYNKETGAIRGSVTLDISYKESTLCIHISDNGSGVDPQTLEILNSAEYFEAHSGERGKHIGLINIHQRLKYLYKENADIVFTSDNGFDTKITIRNYANTEQLQPIDSE